MPTNDSGYVLTIGPDAAGNVFEVAPGEEYDQPAPPVTVTDLEAAAAELDAEPVADDAPAPKSARASRQAAQTSDPNAAGDQGADDNPEGATA